MAKEKRDVNIKDFMIQQLNDEEKVFRKDIRAIKKYISNLDSLKKIVREADTKELIEMVKNDPAVYKEYLEAVRLNGLSYEEWEKEYDEKLAKGEIRE